jgi:molybdopterin molybdotransferase
MISVKEAFEIICNHQIQCTPVRVGLMDSIGKKLAEDVLADSDLPPFNRVMMDGIAIRYEELESYNRFKIQGIQAAGSLQYFDIISGQCIEIMTGALLHPSFDTVIPYEDVTIENGFATITIPPKKFQANVHLKATDFKKGDTLISKGTYISPAEIGILASVGISEPLVERAPRIAIISTGDELVDIDNQPLNFQIRKSNVYAIQAALKKELYLEALTFHVSDQSDEIKSKLKEILQSFEIVILSGGVSKGKFDLIPIVLKELGVNELFHRIKQKPGKPFWFGASDSNLVFALPGNPVSTLVCCYRYLIPFLKFRLLNVSPKIEMMTIDGDYFKKGNLTHFLPVKRIGQMVSPADGNGSGDFAHLANVDGWIEIPEELNEIKKGDTFRYLPFRF